MSSDVQDIEDIVRAWAWEMYDVTKSKEQSKIPRDCLDMTISWKKVRFEHGEPEYTEKDKPPVPKSQVCITGLILGLRPANERRRYKVTPSLIGRPQPKSQACISPVLYFKYSVCRYNAVNFL